MHARRRILSGWLAATLAFVASSVGRAQDAGLPLDVKVAKKGDRLAPELPARVADWPPEYLFEYLRQRVDRPGRDPEPSIRRRYARDVKKLADAGLDGAAVDRDLSGDPSRWPLEHRASYLLTRKADVSDGMTPEAADLDARKAVRGFAAYLDRLQDYVGGSLAPDATPRDLLGAAELPADTKDWPYAWRLFAARLADQLLIFEPEGLSEAAAARAAVAKTRKLYYPKNRELGLGAPPLAGMWESLKDAVTSLASAASRPSETRGINSRLGAK